MEVDPAPTTPVGSQHADAVAANDLQYAAALGYIDFAITSLYKAELGGLLLCEAEDARWHLVLAAECISDRRREMAARIDGQESPGTGRVDNHGESGPEPIGGRSDKAVGSSQGTHFDVQADG